MSAVLAIAFCYTYVTIFQELRTSMSYGFPPRSSVSLALCLTLVTVALVLYLITDTTLKSRIRSTVPVRLGRNQIGIFVLLLISFSVGVIVNYRQSSIRQHPITTLIEQANIEHDQWSLQAYSSQSLAQAVVHYQQRYNRDPPPNFDQWYYLAVARDSIVIDDYDNIEEDLALFSSYTPHDLRLRTATVLATFKGVGGVRIRNGSVNALEGVSREYKWVIDAAAGMIQQFAKYLPDMDLAFNLDDNCRVAVPFDDLQNALNNPQQYPKPALSRAQVDFSADRADGWPKIKDTNNDLQLSRENPLEPYFQTYGSVVCPAEARSRKELHWNTKTFCPTCSRPHAMGAFVSNWSMAANLCHQPDIANLFGIRLGQGNLTAPQNIVPIFSPSRATGFVDIRFPSLWDYLGKSKYSFDEKYPDPDFQHKENVLFWRGPTEEDVSLTGSWKAMLRQRLIHHLNLNTTSRLPIFLPKGRHSDTLEFVMHRRSDIKQLLETKIDAKFTSLNSCPGQNCIDQSREFEPADTISLGSHWRFQYLLDVDGAGPSRHFLPFLQSNSVVLKSGIFREWYDGRLVAWAHFVPVDVRLHDLFSILAYFGGYDIKGRNTRSMEGRVKEAKAIARQSKVWTEKVLRKEDMEVYMFRLLLEWGRLTDDKRTEVGYGMKKGGKKD